VLAIAVSIGLYLLWLWRPEHQVRLHTQHFFHAIGARNWERVADFIGEDYRDQWDHDRARLLERMREGFRWLRGSSITAPDAVVHVEASRAIWIGKINVYSSDDGVMQVLDERVNRLPAPFELEWHHVSGKPWDWKLGRVSNPAFQVPADVAYRLTKPLIGTARRGVRSAQRADPTLVICPAPASIGSWRHRLRVAFAGKEESRGAYRPGNIGR
jgi:hypothetical protein